MDEGIGAIAGVLLAIALVVWIVGLPHFAGARSMNTNLKLVEGLFDLKPCPATLVFRHANQQHGQPAQENVGPDSFGQAMADGANIDHVFQVAKNPFDGSQLLVAKDHVPRRETVVRGANKELPVQALLRLDLLAIDTELSRLRLADVATEHCMRA